MAPGKWIKQPLALFWVERSDCLGIDVENNYPQRKQQGQDQQIPSHHCLFPPSLGMKVWPMQTVTFLSRAHFRAKSHVVSCGSLEPHLVRPYHPGLCNWEWGLIVGMGLPASKSLKTLYSFSFSPLERCELIQGFSFLPDWRAARSWPT